MHIYKALALLLLCLMCTSSAGAKVANIGEPILGFGEWKIGEPPTKSYPMPRQVLEFEGLENLSQPIEKVWEEDVVYNIGQEEIAAHQTIGCIDKVTAIIILRFFGSSPKLCEKLKNDLSLEHTTAVVNDDFLSREDVLIWLRDAQTGNDAVLLTDAASEKDTLTLVIASWEIAHTYDFARTSVR